MKTIDLIACTLATSVLIGPAAIAQGTPPPTTATAATPPHTTPAQSAEQREQAQRDLVRAHESAEQARRLAHQSASKDVAIEVAQVQKALQEAQRQLALYAQGTAALDTARYEKALQAFAEAAALKGSKADSALYWKAFSEYKAQALQAALESLREIRESFPNSRWLEHARALEFEVRHASGEPVSPAATPDEELKLLALNSLLHTDSEQALPMLEKMIRSQQSPRLKKRALFVVSQSRSPRARDILTSVAKSPSDPDLQIEALQYLQVFGGAEDQTLLSGLYATSADKDVKLRVIEMMFAQGDAKSLVDMARKETDSALRKRIVERLSHMKAKEATDYMLELINK